MSYESENELPAQTSIARLKEVVELLGYRAVTSWVKSSEIEELGCYYWSDDTEYKSWTGVELNIYRFEGKLRLHTRTRISRSYWDLTHQNKTIKLIRDLFGCLVTSPLSASSGTASRFETSASQRHQSGAAYLSFCFRTLM